MLVVMRPLLYVAPVECTPGDYVYGCLQGTSLIVPPRCPPMDLSSLSLPFQCWGFLIRPALSVHAACTMIHPVSSAALEAGG